jgi:hypothetical protein
MVPCKGVRGWGICPGPIGSTPHEAPGRRRFRPPGRHRSRTPLSGLTGAIS